MSAPLPATPTAKPQTEEHYWVWVLCLLGLDYFSTLAYQPSLAFEATGRLAPLATIGVVAATLFGALPVYWYLAGRSPRGQGSLALIERLVHGWRGKTLILVLLGFAAADFAMLRSISLADAAMHILRNDDPGWQQSWHAGVQWIQLQARMLFGEEAGAHCTEQLLMTVLIGAVSFAFWFLLRRGFNSNVLRIAVPLIAVYMVLNAMILAGGVRILIDRPGLFEMWLDEVRSGDWKFPTRFEPHFGLTGAAAAAVVFLPRLALGLSGFEMSLIVMPQVRGKKGEDPNDPKYRIRNTRKVLFFAAVIMSIFLLASAFVTAILIPASAYEDDGPAIHRAIAYLAHGSPLSSDEPGLMVLPWCGATFGGIYDLATVLVLAMAGASVMTALASLLPKFMLRFGMDFRWSQKWGLLLIIFAGINLFTTVYYHASVEDQRNAYAVGVLALIAAACWTAALDRRRRVDRSGFWFGLGTIWYRLVFVGFLAIFAVVAVKGWSGLAIASVFIGCILALSVVSRAMRADELRTVGFRFKDQTSKFLWDSLRLADFPVLIPHRPGPHAREDKEAAVRREHQLSPEADIVFLEVNLGDPSDFYQHLEVEVTQQDRRFIITLHGCVSIAHAIASAAMEMSRSSVPPGVHFGWPEHDLLSASWGYLAFGEGNIPWKVRELIHRAEPDPSKRPRVIVG
ncbi:MAG: amino acid transporter [Gemmataceae bacterium]